MTFIDSMGSPNTLIPVRHREPWSLNKNPFLRDFPSPASLTLPHPDFRDMLRPEFPHKNVARTLFRRIYLVIINTGFPGPQDLLLLSLNKKLFLVCRSNWLLYLYLFPFNMDLGSVLKNLISMNLFVWMFFQIKLGSLRESKLSVCDLCCFEKESARAFNARRRKESRKLKIKKRFLGKKSW